jgi:DNA-binding PadR family transcriptional regulator
MKDLGDLESAILVAVLDLEGTPYAPEIRRSVETATARKISRGAFYTTMERLARKGLVAWDLEVPDNSRRDLAQRRYRVTVGGMAALRQKKALVAHLLEQLVRATES